MQIVFGYGVKGKKYIDEVLQNSGEEYVVYDNDRRKWGNVSITLDDLIEAIEDKTNIIVNTTSSITGELFLKDLCATKDNKVFKYDGDRLYEVNLKLIKENNIIANERPDYHEAMNYFLKTGNEKAFKHAREYIDFYERHPDAPIIEGIELTNCCNLKCENCPSPTSKRERGFISDEVFYEACKYIPPDKNVPFYMHALGEPLLHPHFIKYLEYIIGFGVGVCISTNGILFTGDLLERIMEILQRVDNAILYISFHTKKSVESWAECVQWIRDNKKNTVQMYGQILEHNSDQAKKWLCEVGVINPRENEFIREIKTHTFAGNVKGKTKEFMEIEVKNRIRNCLFINGRRSLVAWDGRLMGCCYDSELETKVGNIFDMQEARTSTNGYLICNHCDPNWTASYQ